MPDTMRQLADLQTGGELTGIVVTSRHDPPANIGYVAVAVGPMKPDRLAEFVNEYLPGDDEALAERRAVALEALTRFSKGEPISPLFARMVIEQFTPEGDIPETTPELIDDYVRCIRPLGQPSTLREPDFIRAARVIAHAVVGQECKPADLPEERVRGRLEDEAVTTPFASDDGTKLGSGTIIDQLVNCGLLQRNDVLGQTQIRFAEDPVAEYLTAMYAYGLGEYAVQALNHQFDQRDGEWQGLTAAIADLRDAWDRLREKV